MSPSCFGDPILNSFLVILNIFFSKFFMLESNFLESLFKNGLLTLIPSISILASNFTSGFSKIS